MIKTKLFVIIFYFSFHNSDLEIEVGNFKQSSEYLTANSTIIFQNIGNLATLNFKFYVATEIPNNVSTLLLQLETASAADITYFILDSPDGLTFPCYLDTYGNIRIHNYTGEAIPVNYQLYGQVVFVRKQN